MQGSRMQILPKLRTDLTPRPERTTMPAHPEGHDCPRCRYDRHILWLWERSV